MPQITAHSRRPFDRSILTICFFLSISVIYKMSLYIIPPLLFVLCAENVDCFTEERRQISAAKPIYIIGKAFITDVELP